jgi:hypothetical protein
MDTPVEIRKGMYCYASNPKSVETLGLPNARPWNPLDDDWKLPENWQEIIHEGLQGTAGKIPLLQGVHGHLCALRRLRRQMPFLHRHRRSQEHAGAAGRAAALVYRNDFTKAGKILGKAGRGPSP